MSNLPAVRTLLDKQVSIIQAVIPAGVPITAQRAVVSAILAVRQSDALQRCSPDSILEAVVRSAQLGLDPGGALGEAYLVPYGDRCQLIPGYQGMISLARRSGIVRAIRAHVVCAHDLFEYELGLDVRLRHVPVQDGERGDVRAAYAVADLDGIRQFEVMSRAEIEAVRARSRAGKSGPWVTDFAEMAKKTVVRRLFKYLPKTLQMIELLEADNEDYAPPSSAADVIDVQGSPANGAQAQVRAALAATAPAAEPAPATFSPEEAERQGRKARLEVLWANERAACEAVGMRTLKGIASGSLDSINERIARIEAEVGRRKQRAAEPPPPERYEREPGDEEPEDDELPFGGAPAPEHP